MKGNCPICGSGVTPMNHGSVDQTLCRDCDDSMVKDMIDELRGDREAWMKRAIDAEKALTGKESK